jgi:hypothetical protein
MQILSSIMDDLFEDERQFESPIPFNQIAAALTKFLSKYCSWNICIENSMLLFSSTIRYVAKHGFFGITNHAHL